MRPSEAIGEPKLTLEQRLAAFDPALYAGEVMGTLNQIIDIAG